MNEKWDINTIREYCLNNNIPIQVLDCFYIDKGYQNVLYVKVKTENEEIKNMVWNNILSKKNKTNFSEEWSQEKAFNFLKNYNFTPIIGETFIDVDTSIACKDNIGFIYLISISNLKRQIKQNNIKFSKTRKNPYAYENIQLFCKLYKPDYILLNKEIKTTKDKYKFYYSGPLNSNTPRIFECTLDYFLNSAGGIIGINISKEANLVAGLLRKENINFSVEKTFEDLKSNKGKSLRYDFAVYDENNKLSCLIEYDSIIHFKEISRFHKKNDFLSACERDRKKNAYALAHNIPLIRIPYWSLKTLTAQEIFNNINYKVTTIYHNDRLIIPSC